VCGGGGVSLCKYICFEWSQVRREKSHLHLVSKNKKDALSLACVFSLSTDARVLFSSSAIIYLISSARTLSRFRLMRGICLLADGAMSATLMVPGGVAGGSAEEEETMSLEGKVEAFKSDPQLMEAASRFVADVLEKAKEEAARRSQQNKVYIL
jgi:hypothetical protein